MTRLTVGPSIVLTDRGKACITAAQQTIGGLERHITDVLGSVDTAGFAGYS